MFLVKSTVYQECSTRPWQSDVRELWSTGGDNKLLVGKVIRKNGRYENPWNQVFDEYNAFGDDGWYYIGCTGPEWLFYTPVEWHEQVGCFKQISYKSPDNEILNADIIRAKKTDECEVDETTKYWYDDKWNGKY